MTKRTYVFITAIISAVAAVAAATVTFFNPNCAEAVNASIPVAEGAAIAILGNFVKD